MENEEKYRLLVENIPDVVWTLDEKGKVIFVSPGIKKVCGYTPEEVYAADGCFWHERIHPEEVERVKSACDLLFKSGKALDVEYRIKSSDGNWIWIHDRTISTYEKGGIRYADGIFADVTRYKRTHDEMHLLQSISLAVSASEELRDTLSIMIKKICSFTGWVYGEAWCQSSDGAFLECKHRFNCSNNGFEVFTERGAKYKSPSGIELPGRAWSTRQPMWEQDFSLDLNSMHAKACKEARLKTRIAFPIIADNEVVCVIVFYHEKAEEKDERLIKIISTILTQMGLLIKRKLVEERFRQAENKYRMLVEQIPAITYIAATDMVGTTLYISPQIKLILGFSPEEWMADPESWVKQLYPEDRERVLSEYKRCCETGQAFRSEYRWLTRDGRILWCCDTALLVKDSTGKLFFQGVLTDITEYKRIHEEIRLLQSMTLAISMSKNLHDALVTVLQKICNFTGWIYGEAWNLNPDGTFLERNHTYFSSIGGLEKFSKYTEGFTFTKGLGLPGRTWSEKQAVWVQDVTLDPNYLRTSIVREVGLKTGVAFPVIVDNEVAYVIVFYNTKVEERNEWLIKLISTILLQIGSVIRRKQVEEELYRSEQKLRAILDNAPSIISVKDIQGRYLFINKQYRNLFASKRIELEGKTDHECFPKQIADIYVTHDRQVIEAKVSLQFEEPAVQDGDLLTFLSTKFPLFDFTGAVYAVCSISTDITERKQMQEEMEILEKQFYHSQGLASLGELAGGIAHNFNNLLMVVTGYASLLSDGMKKDDPRREYIQEILNSSQMAANLTQDLLAFSRKKPVKLQAVNLNEIIRGFGGILSRLIGEDIRVKMVLTDKECIVNADSDQIKHVLMNLVTNARDAMPNGGKLYLYTEVTEIDEIFIKAHGYGEVGRYVLVSVTDNGIGMDEDTRLRIFEPFFTTKEIGKGTGLGLSIVYGIIKEHNGYIDVFSEPGKGTTFSIYLPLIETEADQIRQAVPATLSMGHTGTILLAEDEPSVRKLMKTVFERSGYKVIEAGDGEDALDKFMKNKDAIDLLVFDLIMPKKNGKEAYDAIKEMRPDMKVLFISGYGEDFISKTGIHKEGLHFIQKPISAIELLEKVKYTIHKAT